MSQTALIVAIVGLVLSVASLTWQTAMFVMSGSRVRASLLHGARGPGGVASGPPGKVRFEQLVAQGFTQEVIGIQTRNVGRLAVQIVGVAAVLQSGVRVTQLPGTVGPELPHRLEAQSTGTWFLPAAPVRAAVKATSGIGNGKDPCKCWMVAELGNGKTVATRERALLGSR
jgi:hypothetical protein